MEQESESFSVGSVFMCGATVPSSGATRELLLDNTKQANTLPLPSCSTSLTILGVRVYVRKGEKILF